MRGYQVRKKYKVICWAVGILDKVVLRWRRKGVGLRGFKPESDHVDEDEDDDDVIKVFRKEKVNVAIDEAVTRVLSMVESPEAQQQYHRMLGRFQEAKVLMMLIFIDGFVISSAYHHLIRHSLSFLPWILFVDDSNARIWLSSPKF